MKICRKKAHFFAIIFFFFLIFFSHSLSTGFVFAESGIYDKIGIIVEHGLHGSVPEENIDLFTGNLTLRNLDIHLPGPNGFDLKIWRVYNSKIVRDRLAGGAWSIQQEPYAYAGIGWSLHMGRLHGFSSTEPVIEFPDGRWETAYPNANGPDYVTRDFLKYDWSNFKLYFKDGTVWTFGQTATLNFGGGNQEQVRVVTRIENPFGHHIDITYDGIGSPNIKTVTDSMGRVVTFTTINNKLTKISVKNATGATVDYEYTVEEFNGDFHKLTRFSPPEIPAVTYEYEDGQTSDWKLTAVNTSYGGRMEYDYEDHNFYYQVYALQTRVVKEKRIRFETGGAFKAWTYTYPDYHNTAEGTVTVNGPLYTTTATYHAYSSAAPWKIGLIKEKSFSDGSYAEETQWEPFEISYNQWLVLNVNMGSIKAPLLSKSLVIRQGDAASTGEYLYERSTVKKYGLPTKIKYYGGTTGTTLKNYKTLQYYFETDYTFADKYMLDYVKKETVYDSSGSKLKETETKYYTNGAIDEIKRWKTGSTYLTWDYTYSSSNPNDITITINLPGTAGTETHRYRYGVQSELHRPGFTELTRDISSYNSAVKWEKNQHGGTMYFTYDNLDRIKTIDMPPGFNDINASWSDDSVTITRGSSTITKYWDGMGRDTGSTEAGDGFTLYYRKTLDAEGRTVSENNGSTSEDHTIGYVLNAAGNPTSITDPEGNTTTISYNGTQKTVTDAKNHSTVFYYEGLPGAFTKLRDARGKYANYTYDGTGRLTQVSFDSRTHTYGYNGLDQVTSESHPETGTISYEYDPENNLWKKIWAGVTLSYSYNTSNQLKGLKAGISPGDEEITYQYDTRGRVQLISSNKDWSRYNITYNSLGAVTAETQQTAGFSAPQTLQYDYDENNNLESVTYPSGRRLDYTYNKINMPKTLQFNGKSIISQVDYGIQKRPLSMTIAGNGTDYTATYNNLGALETAKVKRSGYYLYDTFYQYDGVGNVRYFNRGDIGCNFTHDELNRLTDAHMTAVSFSYSYDSSGNLETAKENGTVVFDHSYTQQNRISGSVYGYDDHGNITTTPGYTQTWDKLDRLTKIKRTSGETVGSFLYNERDLRLKAARYIPPPPTITVITPDDTSTWCKQETYDITWESTGNAGNDVTIQLYSGSIFVMEVSTTTPNDGLFAWTIPSVLNTGQYTIEIKGIGVPPSVKGVSQPFTIEEYTPPVVNPFTKVTNGAIVTDGGNSPGCAWIDYDNDGFQDLFVANRNANNALYHNLGDGTFEKTTQGAAGSIVSDGGNSFGASWGDFDNDQDPDIFVANYGNTDNFLYENNSGSNFTRLTGPGIDFVHDLGNTFCGSWADYDNDGDLDLFVANRTQYNGLYQNSGSGVFTKILAAPFNQDSGTSHGCTWADIDNDGDLDLFVANYNQEPNFLYRNNGNGTFTRITTDPVVTDGGYSYSGSFGDYDNDGDLDLFVANRVYNNFLYQNNGSGNFTRVTSGDIVNDDAESVGSAWGDYDNDGDLDLVVTNWAQNNFLYSNNGNGTFTKVETGAVVTDSGTSMGCAWADYDNDGLLDLFITNLNGENNFLFKNSGSGIDNHWIIIFLAGELTNSTAVGARVKIKADIDGKLVTQMREISAQTGMGGQNDIRAHFGLGNDTIVNEILVQWPSGMVNRLTDVPADQIVIINENTAPHLTLTSPTGGEKWSVGSTHDITWTSHQAGDTVKLEYSTDNGATFTILDNSTPNDGLFEWTVSNPPTTTGIIRISDTSGQFSDQSPQPFTTLPFGDPITVTSPNGGEQWLIYSPQTITWNSTSSDQYVKIEYSLDNGQTYHIIVMMAENDGQYDWQVPNSTSTSCLVRISETAGSFSDVSDGVFSIYKDNPPPPTPPPPPPPATPTLELTSPNGGETLEVDTDHLITWYTYGGTEFVKLEYTPNGGLEWTTITESTPNTGSYLWHVPGVSSDLCLVRISEVNGTLWDISDAPFLILVTAHYLDITSPNGGENWIVGNTYNITWTAEQSPGNLKITGHSPGSGWFTVTESTEDDGVYEWTIPLDLAPSNRYMLFIDAVDSQMLGYSDNCDGYFTVSALPEADFTRIVTGDIVNDGGNSLAASWADYDNDGFPDLFVTNRFENNALYRNNGDGTFTRVTNGPVVSDGGNSFMGTWGDYDNDGYLDLFVANHGGEHNCLYKNNGDGTFTKITSGPVVSDYGYSLSADWGDYNVDGHLDLYVANQVNANFLYKNNGDGTFTKITEGEVVTFACMADDCSWNDFNMDEYPDLVFLTGTGNSTRLYRGDGSHYFTYQEYSPIIYDLGNTKGTSWGDYNNDRIPDLFITTFGGENYLYKNDPGGNLFKVTQGPIATEVYDAYGSAWGDYDNDGDLDLYVAGPGPNHLYRNEGYGMFTLNTPFTSITGGGIVTDSYNSYGCAWGDYDNDGDLDLFVANMEGQNNCLYMNNSENNNNNWIKIKCVGKSSNAAAIGVRVEIRATINGNTVYLSRCIAGHTGRSGQNSQVVHFGLGDAEIVEGIWVFWPGGYFQVLEDFPVNQVVTIIEGENSPGAEINVQIEGSDIPTGSTVNLGNVTVGTHKDVEFTIQSNGFSDLELGYPAVSLGGPDKVEFSIIDDPATVISPGHTTTFTVRFSPATVGAKSAFLTIPSNDSDEDPYIINLTGNNAAAASVLNYSHLKSFAGSRGGFSKEPLAAGGNVEISPVLEYNYNPYESDYENDDNHGSYAGNGPYEPINGGSMSMNTNISTTQSLQLTTSYYFYSFDNKLMAEYDETGNCIREYIYMGDRLIAEYLPQSNQYYYYTTDHINSTHMVTDDNGEKVYYTLFGPYGERIPPLEQVTTYDPQLKFSGKEREPEAEIDYFGARYYDYNSYRFISVDPIINKEEALSNPQLWNLYAYCRNNPVTYRDPDGRKIVVENSLKSQINIVRTYLRTSPTARRIINELDKPNIGTIKVVRAHGDSWYDAHTKTIYFDPLEGNYIGPGQIQSPAIIFFHECAHALRNLKDPEGQRLDRDITVPDYYNWEEVRVISLENRVIRQINEKLIELKQFPLESTRYTHDVQSVRVGSPTSRKRLR